MGSLRDIRWAKVPFSCGPIGGMEGMMRRQVPSPPLHAKHDKHGKQEKRATPQARAPGAVPRVNLPPGLILHEHTRPSTTKHTKNNQLQEQPRRNAGGALF